MIEHPDMLLFLVRDHQQALLREARSAHLLAALARGRRSPVPEKARRARPLIPQLHAHA